VAGEIRVNRRDQAEYVFVPAGAFLMGSQEPANEAPVHEVNVESFWIGRTEVTNEQYGRCVDADVCTPPGNPAWRDAARAKYPVTHVNWSQAATYAEWAGGRLPSEAEWEKAARGPDQRLYPWGDAVANNERLNFQFANGGVMPVGTYPAGASPYGVLDMAGNVEEWVADWYAPDYYAQSPRDNPPGPERGIYRVVRGGSFHSSRGDVRTTHRGTAFPDAKFESVGFRVVVPQL
jgi:formylglycine-generating enzyme required for sulfatase activity